MTVVLVGCPDHTQPNTQRVSIAGRTFTLELAMDQASRYQGLSDRHQIPQDGGMLFVFPDVQPRVFVMRRCYVPLDLIYLGPNGRIVAIHEMVVEPPETPEQELYRYSSHWPAQFALELKGKTARALGLKLGVKIDLPLDTLKQNAR